MEKVFYFDYSSLKDYINKSFECVFKKLPILSKKELNKIPQPFEFVKLIDIEKYLFKLSRLSEYLPKGLSMTLPFYDYNFNEGKLTIFFGIIVENTEIFKNLGIKVDIEKIMFQVLI